MFVGRPVTYLLYDIPGVFRQKLPKKSEDEIRLKTMTSLVHVYVDVISSEYYMFFISESPNKNLMFCLLILTK